MLSLIISLIGCSKKTEITPTVETTTTEATAEAATEAATEAAKVETLTLSTHASWVNAGMQALIDYVNSKSAETGAIIELDMLPEGEQGDNALQTRFATQEYPDITAFYSANNARINLGGSDVFADISGEWMADYDQDIIASNQFSADGKVIAAPFGPINLTGMIYNKKVFADLELSVPKTWDEFLTACETIKAAGIVPVYYSGADPWTLQLIPIVGFARELVGKDSKDIFEKLNTNKLQFTELTKFEDSIVKYKSIYDLGYTNTDTVFSDTYDNAQKALIEGKAAMYCMATWVIPGMIEAYGEEAVNNLGAFPVPFDGNDPVTAWLPWTMLVPEEGKHRDLAIKIVQLMASKEGQQVFYDAEAAIPLIKGVNVKLSPSVQELYTIFSEEGRSSSAFEDRMNYGGDVFENNLAEVIVGTMTPHDVLVMKDEAKATDAKAKEDPNWK